MIVTTTSGKKPAKPSEKNSYKDIKAANARMQFLYYNPVDKKDMPFPKDVKVNIIFVDDKGHEGPTQYFYIMNSNGEMNFTIEPPNRTNMYFEMLFDKPTYFNITTKKLVPENELTESVKKDSLYLTKNMLFLLPKRLSLKNTWWDIGDHPSTDKLFYDEKKRLFTCLKDNKLQGNTGPLKVTLKADWQYVSFRYFDRDKKSDQSVPQYLMLEGYNEDISSDTPVARSNLFTNNCICLPWIEDNCKTKYRNPKDIVLKFKTSYAFLESGNPPKIMHAAHETIRYKPLLERFKFYDLPKLWVSSNWQARLGTEVQVFGKLVNRDTSESSPLVVDLDATVLTDTDLDCKSWKEKNRFTVFDMKLDVMNPVSNKPYLTDDTLKINYFDAKKYGSNLRLIALNGEFYDVTDKRSRKGDVIGARAAMLNDKDVHHGEEKEKPVCFIGNFELHFLKDCLDQANNPVSVLMIYWSAKFEKGSGANDSDVTNFEKNGMKNSKRRWEYKDYLFQAKDASAKIPKIRPVFFFEGRSDSPYKCAVELRTGDFRASMGISSAHFRTSIYQATGGSFMEDGKSFAQFTMAHELGHAVGLNDEYVESIEEDNKTNVEPVDLWNPPIPQFDQYYPGMPYSCDDRSMMNINIIPRLRHFWYFCRWLNETPEVKKLSGNAVYQVNYSGGVNYNYFLKDNTKNYYEPVNKEEKVKNGKYGIFDLFLYKIGNDESTDKMIPPKRDFDGILIVRSKLQWFFDNYDGNTWAVVGKNLKYLKLKYLRFFQKAFSDKLNNRYYIQCAAEDDFKKVYVYFVPHYYFEGTTISDHFEITVKANPGPLVRFRPDFFNADFKKDEFEVDQQQDNVSIMRYILGLATYSITVNKVGGKDVETKNLITSITKDDLGFLAEWIKKQRGKGLIYTVMS